MPTANVPQLEDEDMKYDIKYFSRNTRREGHLDSGGDSLRLEDAWTDSKEVALIDADAPRGSPGNHYTAPVVKEYDPSGLRSAMTATHEETYKAIQKRMPTHNVSYAWSKDIEAVVASYKDNGLPPVPGLNISGVTTPEPICIVVKHSTW